MIDFSLIMNIYVRIISKLLIWIFLVDVYQKIMSYGDIFSFNDNLFVIWLDVKNEDYIKILEKK